MMRYFIILFAVILLAACRAAGDTAGDLTSAPATAALAATLPVASPASTQPQSASVALTPTATLPPPADTAASPAASEPTAAVASAVALPDPAAYTWQPVASDLRSPVSMAHAGDGSGRLFVIEQRGRIRIVQQSAAPESAALQSAVLPEPFLDITSQVGSEGNEQGLLGLAFHPRYAENGFFYVNYTRRDGDTVIARFRVSPDNPNAADPASETQLLLVPQPYANHNGGAVVFGPDGYLYLALGDGGAAGDPQGNAQSLNTLLGKILRIDVDNTAAGGQPYAIPAGNPFAAGGGLPEIWAYGLRNPWRIAFDRLTGELFFADVGQNQWEEVNYLPAGAAGGANFGWDYFEGTHPFEGSLPPGVTVVSPIAEYSHAEGGCSITGGFVYRGPSLPAFQGVYLYGDFCSGNVWGLLRTAGGGWQNGLLYRNVGRITSFGEDEAGEIYLLDRTGVIYKLSGT